MFSLRGDSLPKIPVTPHEGPVGLPRRLSGGGGERPVTGGEEATGLRALLETVPPLQKGEGKRLGARMGSKLAYIIAELRTS